MSLPTDDPSPNETATQIANPDDIFIAVMGLTGTGKSTFIATCTEQELTIGHGLESCTSSVSMHTMKHNGRTVHLIDTPGFDDTHVPLADTLQEIIFWLTKAYQLKIKLSGIVYLHNISAPRLQGSGMKSLSLFKKLCGTESFCGVALATTMWHTVCTETGDERQRELASKSHFWGEMGSAGSLICAHSTGRTSAMGIIDHIVLKNQRLTLAIQREMVDEGKPFNETAVGGEFIQISEDARRELEQKMTDIRAEFQAASDEKDREFKETLRQDHYRTKQEIASRSRDIERSRRTLDQMNEEWERKVKDDMERIQREIDEVNQRCKRKAQEAERVKMEYEALLKDPKSYSQLVPYSQTPIEYIAIPPHNHSTAVPHPHTPIPIGYIALPPHNSSTADALLVHYQNLTMTQARELQELKRLQQKQTRDKKKMIAAYETTLATGGVAFAGVSAVIALLPLLACTIM